MVIRIVKKILILSLCLYMGMPKTVDKLFATPLFVTIFFSIVLYFKLIEQWRKLKFFTMCTIETSNLYYNI